MSDTGVKETLRLIVEDVGALLWRSIEETRREACIYVVEMNKNKLIDLIEQHSVGLLSFPFNTPTKFVQNFESGIERLTPVNAEREPWKNYYDERRSLMKSLFHHFGVQGELPDLPYLYVHHNLRFVTLNNGDAQVCKEMLTWGRDKVWVNNNQRAENQFKYFFQQIQDFVSIPRTFAETITDQSVKLWGKSAKEVYEARRWILLEVVLKESLERLRRTLDLGCDYCEELISDYKWVRDRACQELDDWAAKVPDHRQFQHLMKKFSYDEMYKRFQEVQGNTDFEKWYNVFIVEWNHIKEYYYKII